MCDAKYEDLVLSLVNRLPVAALAEPEQGLLLGIPLVGPDQHRRGIDQLVEWARIADWIIS